MRKLRDADALLNAGMDQAAVLQGMEVSEATCLRLAEWAPPRSGGHGGKKASEAKQLKELEVENKRLMEIVAEQADFHSLRATFCTLLGIGIHTSREDGWKQGLVCNGWQRIRGRMLRLGRPVRAGRRVSPSRFPGPLGRAVVWPPLTGLHGTRTEE